MRWPDEEETLEIARTNRELGYEANNAAHPCSIELALYVAQLRAEA